jgi:simple sugar transport system substrate-binding protein
MQIFGSAGMSRRVLHAARGFLLAGATLALATAASADDVKPKIIFVGVAAPTGFHAYINKGAMDAAANLGVDVTYVYPDTPTLPAQVEKITAAIAAGANGIIINGVGDDAAYYDVIAQGKAQGIAFGSALGPKAGEGTQLRNAADPFLFHVGSDEYAGGVMIGQQLLALGIKGPVVVGNDQPTDSATCQPRSAGVVDTIKKAGLPAQVQELTLDLGQTAETLTTYLRAHPDTVALVSACTVTGPFLEAKRRAEMPNLVIAAWDLDETGVAAIKSGEQAFTIDQQQYWRGYMPVLLMTHYLKYGLIQSNAFLTGPAIIDKSNIDAVQKLVTEGYR